MKRISIVLVLLLIIASMSGCKGGGGGSGQVKISISPQDVTLLLGAEKQFTAVVTGLSDQGVTWSATGGEIDDDGLYRATEVGIFEVRATSKAAPSKTAGTKVYVSPPGVDEFSEVTAWEGTVRWQVKGSWSSSGGSGITYDHKINEDITREYRLEDKRYEALLQRDVWRRPLDSAVVVSGTIKDRSDKFPGNGYCEINWTGPITVDPETLDYQDYLSIDESAGIYTIELYSFIASSIPCTIYDSLGDPWETWDEFRFEDIKLTNQPLPSVVTTLTGSKTEKRLFSPLWGSEPLEPKELEVTITWSFVPQ